MPLHAHLLSIFSSIGTEPLRARLNRGVRVTEGSEIESPETVEVLVGGFPEARHVDACPRLRALIVPFAGTPVETYTLLRNYPQVTLHSLHYNAVPTAEMAVALLLAAAKLIVPMDRDLRRGDWSSRYVVTPVTRVDGKRALILGYGKIGRHVARACRGMGMEVVGVRRNLDAPAVEEGVEVFPTAALWDLLPRADALMMALPETPETVGLVGARELGMLPDGAIVVNVGRGPTLDEAALYDALCSGRLRAAGIDVWYTYPHGLEGRTHTAPSRFPFHELDNVVMSPHRAGWLSDAEIERMQGLAEMLNAAEAGEPIPSAVDKELGY